MASWPEGDGAGMCTGSFWPDVSVSAQVVGVSRRGARGSLGSGRSAGCAIGEGRTSPRLGAMAGIRSRPYPGRAPALAWLPGPSTTHVQSSRRVLTRSDRNKRAARGACRGVRVRARLRSLMAYAHVVMLRRGVPGLHSRSFRGITGLHSVITRVSRVSPRFVGQFGASRESSWGSSRVSLGASSRARPGGW